MPHQGPLTAGTIFNPKGTAAVGTPAKDQGTGALELCEVSASL